VIVVLVEMVIASFVLAIPVIVMIVVVQTKRVWMGIEIVLKSS